MRQYAVAGMLRAAQNFDTSRGLTFWTHAQSWVNKYLHSAEVEGRMVAISEKTLARLKFVKGVEYDIERTTGRPPGLEELRETLRGQHQVGPDASWLTDNPRDKRVVPLRELRDLRLDDRIVSLDRTSYKAEDGETVLDMLETDDRALLRQVPDAAPPGAKALKQLTDRERLILETVASSVHEADVVFQALARTLYTNGATVRVTYQRAINRLMNAAETEAPS
jgi:DNA-directed RNA polymerase specialized sigma subunit